MTTMPATEALDRDAAVLGSGPYRAVRVAAASIAVAYLVSTLIPLAHRPPLLDTVGYSGLLICATLLALLRPALVRTARATWTCVGLGIACWAVGDVYWTATFANRPAGDIPVPSVADACYVGLYPLAYAGFILLARGAARRLPAAVWLDALVSSLAAGAVFSGIAMGQVLHTDDGADLAGQITNLLYPVGDLVLLAVAVAALTMVRWRPDPVWWLLGLGAALFAVADTAYLIALDHQTYEDGGWIDGLWILGLTLMAYAASLPRRRVTTEVRGFAALLVPILFSLAALGVLVVGTFVRLHPVAVLLAAACLIAAGVRTALTFEQTRELARTRVAAHTDLQSGLGNRRALDAELPTLLHRLRPGSQLYLTILGIDHMSEINGTLGYPVGDLVLNAVGERLRREIPADAVCARLGGVELAVLRTVRPGTDPAEVLAQTRALVGVLAEPVEAGDLPVHIEVSAGIAAAPAHAATPEALIRCAADALRTAREHGTGIEAYDPALDAGSRFGPQLFPDLLRAFAEEQFVTYYQPKVDVATGRPVALEAVLRWHHPHRGLIEAEDVQPLAARVGLRRRLTRALLESSVQACAGWLARGVELGVAADIDVPDILDSQLPYDLAKMINRAGIPPGAVTLEVAEDVLLVDPRRTSSALGQFRHFGLRLALDHYGRSAPSLTRLRTLPVDEIKLDASFVAPVPRSTQDAAVVRSTIELARSLNIATVAEGVAAQDVLAALTTYGCSGVQGPLPGEPMDPEQLDAWLATQPVRSPRRVTAPAPRRGAVRGR
ncbi:bifunctional diguanylate cyclase/phosphodiesterase [Rhizomonospora bruguierae]|uniref:bifunctional diguanylate cyclase/phosphodiesterase n=1 Tax=Rhizomonospora bruguierae TaxID=1581705 RepID=UPI001BCF36A6|nr:bifunctional diguanylate cyclase/phosphodiesterase [Micromonospora sp. NBRC 107566]